MHLSSRRSLYCVWRELQAVKPNVTERAAQNTSREQALGPGEAVHSEGQEPGLEETMRIEGQSMLEAALGISNEQGATEAYAYPEQGRGETQEDAIGQQGSAAQEEMISRQGSAAQGDVISRQESAIQEETISQQRNAAQKDATSQQGSAIPERTAKREGKPERETREMPKGQSESKKAVPPEELFAAKTSVEPQPPKQEELHTAETQRTVSQEPPAMPMSEEKWQQLQRIYPHIRPFQDEREYLSLRPEDFVILRTNSYRLVQNSFLLHGFYDYKHLILTHVSQKNARQYYIGVPGNFYEKEKQVAIMYGFDSFECKREPAEEGDIGYYMIRVEL